MNSVIQVYVRSYFTINNIASCILICRNIKIAISVMDSCVSYLVHTNKVLCVITYDLHYLMWLPFNNLSHI